MAWQRKSNGRRGERGMPLFSLTLIVGLGLCHLRLLFPSLSATALFALLKMSQN
jgi:hypothetical protein